MERAEEQDLQFERNYPVIWNEDRFRFLLPLWFSRLLQLKDSKELFFQWGPKITLHQAWVLPTNQVDITYMILFYYWLLIKRILTK